MAALAFLRADTSSSQFFKGVSRGVEMSAQNVREFAISLGFSGSELCIFLYKLIAAKKLSALTPPDPQPLPHCFCPE